MPALVCTNCGRRRPVVDYLARLPMRCTGCGSATTVDWDEAQDTNTADTSPSLNGRVEADGESSAVIAKASVSEEAERPLEPSSVPFLEAPGAEAAAVQPVATTAPPSDFAISITPDRELSPLVVSEKMSVSSFQLPSQAVPAKLAYRAPDDVSEKSKFADRLKEIASLPAPPKAEPAPASPVEAFESRIYLEPAAAWKRFVARCIVNGLGYLAFIAGIGFLMTLTRVGIVGANADSRLRTVLMNVPTALYLFIHVALLASRGQDVGKMLMRIRIVKDDGTPAGLKQTFLLRDLVFQLIPIGLIITGALIARLPAVGLFGYGLAFVAFILPLIDAISVLSSPGRSLHDQLAGTQVVEGGPPSAG